MTGPRRFRLWRSKGHSTHEVAPQPASFDAIISVGPYNLPQGIPPTQAVAAIEQAVQALPGAAWIVVAHHPIGSGAGAVQVFPTGCGELAGAGLHSLVEQAVADAVRRLPLQPPPAPPRCDDTALAAHGEFVFPEPAAGVRQGLSDSQAFTPISLRDLAAASTAGSPPDALGASVQGLQAATDAALLAQLLGSVGILGAVEFAPRIIARLGSFAAVLSTSELELRKISGLGTHGIAAIKLVYATALRLSQAAIMNMPLLDRPDLLMRYLTAVLARESIEHFRILFLDADGRLRADEAQARGTVNHTPVYPREVIRRALELKAAAIILVHNHPSGDPSPSQDDIEMTATIAELAKVFSLDVQDHIIVGNGRRFSFRDAGLLDPGPD